MSYTPGPWKVATTFIEGGQFPGIYREDAIAQWGKPAIAHAIDDDPNCEANARLIAAAPELLELLITMNEALQDGITCRLEPGSVMGSRIRRAVRKATGP